MNFENWNNQELWLDLQKNNLNNSLDSSVWWNLDWDRIAKLQEQVNPFKDVVSWDEMQVAEWTWRKLTQTEQENFTNSLKEQAHQKQMKDMQNEINRLRWEQDDNSSRSWENSGVVIINWRKISW